MLYASVPAACVARRHSHCKGGHTADARRSPSRAGFNVILVSRTESKLTAVATDLEARYGVQTKVVPADFAAMEDATWDAIAAVLGSVPLGVLINSAGQLRLIAKAALAIAAGTGCEGKSSCCRLHSCTDAATFCMCWSVPSRLTA